jgi:hypothetical protein
VSGSVGGARPTYTVTVRVAGLAGRTGGLRIEATGGSVVRTADGRCTATRTVAVCQLSGDTSVTVEVVAPQGATVAAALAPSGSDADAGNNTWSATLG